MGEWWTYRLADFLLFSPRTYQRLFELYNAAVWPAGQVLAFAAGLAVLALRARPGPTRARAALLILAACWLWVAWAFFLERYATINWVAPYAAAAFALQALLLLLAAGIGGAGLANGPGGPWRWRGGVALVLFALFVQPLLGPLLAGRAWSGVELLGLAPDPTAVATVGAMATLGSRWRWGLLAVPVLWCAATGATGLAMSAPEAWIAPLAAVFGVALAASRPRAGGTERPGGPRPPLPAA